MSAIDRIFRITPGLERKVAARSLRMLIIIFACMLPIFLWQNHDMVGIGVLVFCYLIFAGIYYAGRQWALLMYSRLTFRITDDEVWRQLDIDDDQLNFSNRYFWKKVQVNTPRLIVIRWENIESVTDKGTHLVVRRKANSIGPPIIVIPKEVENFDELSLLIEAKIGTIRK